jgi:hypothetical protein
MAEKKKAKKKAVKKKAVKKDKFDPSKYLGTGLADRAAKGLRGRALRLKKAECVSSGGTWKNGKCT